MRLGATLIVVLLLVVFLPPSNPIPTLKPHVRRIPVRRRHRGPPTPPPPTVFVSFGYLVLGNHSYVNFNTVGDTRPDRVRCITDLETCCSMYQGFHRGYWYTPGGQKLGLVVGSQNVYEAREDRSVELCRRGPGNAVSGIYRCDINTKHHSDLDRNMETIFIGLYDSGGDVQITTPMTLKVNSDLKGTTPQFTLTCISTGGPATNVEWILDSTLLTNKLNTSSVLVDPVTAKYTHTLTINGHQEGLYMCKVSNNKPSEAFAEVGVKTPSPPSDVTVSQNGLHSALVSWNAPAASVVTGYIVYYQRIDTQQLSSVIADASDTTITITRLVPGAIYSILVVATFHTLTSAGSPIQKLSIGASFSHATTSPTTAASTVEQSFTVPTNATEQSLTVAYDQSFTSPSSVEAILRTQNSVPLPHEMSWSTVTLLIGLVVLSLCLYKVSGRCRIFKHFF